MAKQFLKHKATVEKTLGTLRQSLAVAIEVTEQVKVAIQAEEARLQQENLQTTLGQFNFNENQTSWAEVERRVQEKESRVGAIKELQNLGIEAKIHEIEMFQLDLSTEQELEALERKLGIGGSPALNYNTGAVQQIQNVGGGEVTR
jgi:hypothetical protein